MKNLKTFIIIVFLCLINLCGVVTSQEEKTDPGALQRMAREKYTRLIETLSKLSRESKEKNSERSDLLKAVIRFCGEKDIAGRMEKIHVLLGDESWQDALDEMAKVEKDLKTMLELLLSKNKELLDLLKKIQQLEEMKKRAQELIRNQQEERDLSAKTAALKELLESINTMMDKLADLERRERGLALKQNDIPQKQGKILEETRKCEPEIKRIDEEEKRLTGGNGNGAAKALSKAAAKMAQAKKTAAQSGPSKAVPQVKESAQKLAEARGKLAKAAEKVKNQLDKLDLEEQAKRQEKTAEATGKLAEKLKSALGNPNDGGNGMKNAVPHQEKAAKSLGKGKPGGATPEQDQALDEMKKAKDEIEETLEQMKKRLQEEMLRALEDRLTEMLILQKRISAQTKLLDKKRSSKKTASRATRLKSKKFGLQERLLSKEAETAMNLMKEEGSTIVIPEILDSVKTDLIDLYGRLTKADTGPVTREIQGEVENLLESVIEAIKQAQEDQKDQSGKNNNQNQNQDQPLVPRSAEVRMIRILQNAVYRATLRANVKMETNAEEGRERAARLALKQKRIHELTKKLAERIDKDLAEEDKEK